VRYAPEKNGEIATMLGPRRELGAKGGGAGHPWLAQQGRPRGVGRIAWCIDRALIVSGQIDRIKARRAAPAVRSPETCRIDDVRQRLQSIGFDLTKYTNDLAAIYEQLNAPFGQFGANTLTASTRAVTSPDDSVYNSIEGSIQNLTSQRDALALKIGTALDDAAFNNKEIKEKDAKDWISQAQALLNQAAGLAAG